MTTPPLAATLALRALAKAGMQGDFMCADILIGQYVKTEKRK